MEEVLDHPVIHNMERTGEPDGLPVLFPICPICGAECVTFYQAVLCGIYEIVGCEECVREVDAWVVYHEGL